MPRSLILIVSFLAVSPAAWTQAKDAKTPPAAAAPAKPVLARAQEHFQKKEYRQATELLWANVTTLERAGFVLLIKAHKAKNEWNEVIRASNLLLSKNGRDEEAMTFLGEAQYRRQNKPEEAKETLKKVLEINPKYQPAYEILAQIYEKNPYERRILYQDMLEIFGPKADFLTQLCTLNTNDGENEQGEKYCEQAIEKASGVPDNHVNLGIIAKQKGETDVAKKRLRAAADRFPSSEFAQFEQAHYMEAEKNWLDANKYFEACVKADAKSDRCWTGIGNSAIQLKNYERALQAFSKSCQIAGRKSAPIVRRAVSVVLQRKDGAWGDRLSSLADRCSYL